MGGKGKRRRERNYKAAHGGFSRLPPPPNPSSVDALPSKLRQLVSLTSGTGGKVAADGEKRKKRVADAGNDKKDHLNDESTVEFSRNGYSHEDGGVVNEEEDALSQEETGANKKQKARRKRNQVTDLRFQEEVLGVGSKRRERKKKCSLSVVLSCHANYSLTLEQYKYSKCHALIDIQDEGSVVASSPGISSIKQSNKPKIVDFCDHIVSYVYCIDGLKLLSHMYLEERKKRLKRGKTGENLEFPGQEKIKFGDIVQAPPKLNKIPKAFKTGQDASKERLRLKAVEAYRQRKGWDSRPGVHLPPPVAPSQSD